MRRSKQGVLTISPLVTALTAYIINKSMHTNTVDNLDIVPFVFSQTQPFLIASKDPGELKVANHLCPAPVQKTMKTIRANTHTQLTIGHKE